MPQDSAPSDDIPMIISVDDHVMEPPTLWTDRLPSRYADRMPRVKRERGHATGKTGTDWTPAADGVWGDIWYYENMTRPVTFMFAAAGLDKKTLDFGEDKITTFDNLRPGTWQAPARIADMELNHTDVSICFPNTVPRFCGQEFAEKDDKELSLLCVQAYNDWMIDEWCGGESKGRLIPLAIVPLWDAELAAAEIERCAAKGCFGVSFSENPYALGFPSIHSDFWDPFFAACEATETTICMHTGSSSRLPETAPEAPHAITSVLLGQNVVGSLLDWLLSGVMERFPTLKLAYSEANVGWMPYVLERVDKIWDERGRKTAYGIDLPQPPSLYVKDRIYGCIIDDEVGIEMRDKIYNQICFETDLPHADSKWPDSKAYAERIIKTGELDDDEVYAFLRGNAIKAFGLERFGVDA